MFFLYVSFHWPQLEQGVYNKEQNRFIYFKEQNSYSL